VVHPVSRRRSNRSGDATEIQFLTLEQIEEQLSALEDDVQMQAMVATLTLRKGVPPAWGNRSRADVRMVVLVVPSGCEQAMELIANSEKLDVFAIAQRFHITPLGPTP
jgi:hypothetical protein